MKRILMGNERLLDEEKILLSSMRSQDGFKKYQMKIFFQKYMNEKLVSNLKSLVWEKFENVKLEKKRI